MLSLSKEASASLRKYQWTSFSKMFFSDTRESLIGNLSGNLLFGKCEGIGIFQFYFML